VEDDLFQENTLYENGGHLMVEEMPKESISVKTIKVGYAEVEDLKEKFEILRAPQKHSKEGKLDLQFLKHLPKSLNKMRENGIAALQPKHLYFVCEKRYENERQRLLQKFMKSFEFGGVMSGKRMSGSKFAFNNAVTFLEKGISFYRESFGKDLCSKKIKFQLHWEYKSFPLLIEFENKKFLFKYLLVSKTTDFITGVAGIYFFYFNVNDPRPTDGIRIIFDDIIFHSQGKPSFIVKSSNFIKPELNIAPIEASKMIDGAVWFDVEEIKNKVNEKL
jgi:hypothetical protein